MIKSVKLNQKSYPIFFSNFVLAQWGEMYNLSMNELFSLLSSGFNDLRLDQLYNLAFLAFKAGHKHAGEDFKFNDVEELALVLDKDPGWMEKVIGMIAEFFPAEAEKPATKKKSLKK